MYAGALFIQQALHWDLYIAVAGLLAITAVYTVAGAWLSFRSEHSRSSSACACNAQNSLMLLVGALNFTFYLFLP